MWATSRPADTAEWQCVRCGVINRRLVAPGATEARDRCVSCGKRHVVRPGDTPVRWSARAS